MRKYFRALRRAQRDIDLRPELYTHYYKKEFPVRFHDQMDTRRWGPGERLVFEPYSKQTFEESFEWIEQHGIFPRGRNGQRQIRSLDFRVRRPNRRAGVGASRCRRTCANTSRNICGVSTPVLVL